MLRVNGKGALVISAITLMAIGSSTASAQAIALKCTGENKTKVYEVTNQKVVVDGTPNTFVDKVSITDRYLYWHETYPQGRGWCDWTLDRATGSMDAKCELPKLTAKYQCEKLDKPVTKL